MRKLLGLILFASAVWAQVAANANSGYKTAEGRAQVAAYLDSPERETRDRPKELVAALGLKPGDTVIDAGTGTGFMLPYLSRAVGTSGKVIGEDIQTDFLDRARARATHEGLKNVSFVLGSDNDPRLPARSADLILVLDAYHHFDYPEKMLAAFQSSLRPGGRLAIVDYYKRRGAMGGGDSDRALQHIRLDADDLVKEVESNGYRLLSRREHIPNSQYIAIFARN